MRQSSGDFMSTTIIRTLFAAMVVLAGGIQAAQAQAPDLEFYGYGPSSTGQKFASQALEIANSILAASSKFKLRAGWARAAGKASETDLTVVLVAPTSTPFVIQVPDRSCRCIFMQVEAFRTNLATYSTKLKQMMAIEPAHMLAFMLLHEVGHIEGGDPGAFEKEGADFNYADTVLKGRERAADEFAAKALMVAATDTTGFLNSMKMQMALSHASLNLSAVRLLDNFGGSTLCLKALFADRGLSHPNFELRILAVNDMLSSTSTSRELVRQFEDCRKPNSR